MKRALITGITGMDGSHLADFLLLKDYEVHGLVRRTSLAPERLKHLDGSDRRKTVFLWPGDVLDQSSLDKAVLEIQPDEVYHLAAQSFVGTSWDQPVLTSEVTALGTLRLLEAVRRNCPEARVYQASSSEMFGNAPRPQNEESSMHPRSPYGVAKLFAHAIAHNYRESYDMFVACGILFNHESERRGLEFVTRKITRQVAEIVHNQRDALQLGDLNPTRDWGYAPDYIEGMWQMLQHSEPDDFVLATGVERSIRDFVHSAYRAAGLPILKVGIDTNAIRPAELYRLCGDSSKAADILGWTPKTKFDNWVERMVTHDIAVLGERA